MDLLKLVANPQYADESLITSLLITLLLLFLFFWWGKRKSEHPYDIIDQTEDPYNILKQIRDPKYIEPDIQEIVSILAEALDKKKDLFLTCLKSAIKSYISNKDTCTVLALTTQNSQSHEKIQWRIDKNGQDYLSKLLIFLFWEEKKYEENGNEYLVDSALTDEVVNIVKKEILHFYQENQEEISRCFVLLITHNQKISQGFLNYIVSKYLQSQYKTITSQLKENLVQVLTDKLLEESSNLLPSIKHNTALVAGKVASTSIVSTVTVKMSAIAANSASSTVARVIAKSLLIQTKYLIEAKLGFLIGKLMAIPIIKTAIKKLVVAAIVASLYKSVAVKLGISASSVLSTAVVAVASYYIFHEWRKIPHNLGESIAKSITNDLEGNFSAINKDMLYDLFKDLFNFFIDDVATKTADDSEIQATIGEFLKLVE